MKRIINISITLLLSVLVLNSSAQNQKISGTISGIDGPIEGVKVNAAGTKIKAISNYKGEYSIEIPLTTTHLLFQKKNSKKTVAVASATNNLDVSLIPSEKNLIKTIRQREEIRLCDIYMDNYPKGAAISEVKLLKEKYLFIEAYNIAASQFSDTALRNYLKMYPEGTYQQKAFDAIEIAAWQKARFENTADAYKNYLSQFPNGKATKLAKEKLAELNK